VKQLRKYLRPIPAVMALAFVLLAVKGAGLAIEARAQDGQASSAPAVAAKPAAASADPAADDVKETSAGEVDVLTSLSRRRNELDDREQALAMRENLLAAAAKRVDDKISELKQLQSQLQALLGQRDAAEQKQLDVLVKSYSSMKPRDAARIFESLDEDVLLAVSSAMKSDVLGAVLAQMNPDSAQKLTVKLANRLKVKDPQPSPPAQVAALTPAVVAPVANSAEATAQPLPAAAAARTASTTPPPSTQPATGVAAAAPSNAGPAVAPAK
jgi:flagellar motility protein MotE (MotC chaperone)